MSTESIEVEASAVQAQGRPIAVRGSWLLLRPEEWVLLCVLASSSALCLAYGHGFDGTIVLTQYLGFFAGKVMLVCLATRLLFGFAARFRPADGSLGLRAKRFVFGRDDAQTGLLATDLEVCRGLIWLFVTLTVYTNVKLRIPLINSFIADPTFQKIDDFLFGKELWPWLERTTQANVPLRSFLESVYFHDYIYFVVLVLLLYLRRDRLGLRWLFQSVAFTYILGVLITLAYPTLGPCFIRLHDYQWVQELMPMVGQTQLRLWRFFSYVVQAGRAGMEVRGQVFMGIAAFPSLHVGHMMILSLVAMKRYRIYLPVSVTMTLLTFVATMAFGWHYAVDAIGGIALAMLVCAVLWRLLSRWEADAAATELPSE